MLQNITEDEIKQIEAEALRKYKETHDPVERRDRKSRSADLLNQFFEKYPNVPRVSKKGDLSPEDRKRYNRFLRALNPEAHRAYDRAYYAVHREELSKKGIQKRLENPEPSHPPRRQSTY